MTEQPIRPWDIKSQNVLPPVLLSPGQRGLQAFADGSKLENPPPDPRLVNHPWIIGLQKGRISQTYDWVRSLNSQTAKSPLESVVARVDRLAAKQGNRPYAVNFMYNPSDIQVSYGIDSSVLPSSQLTAAQQAASAIYPGMTTLTFALLFDRTFECYDPTYASTPLGQMGVYADIAAFEYMVGAIQNGLPSNMLAIPLVVIFGGGKTAGVGKPGLSYVGFITNAGVDYSHFTQSMVPMRASLSITMTLLIGQSPADASNPALTTSPLTVAGNSYGSMFAQSSTAADGTNGIPDPAATPATTPAAPAG